MAAAVGKDWNYRSSGRSGQGSTSTEAYRKIAKTVLKIGNAAPAGGNEAGDEP
jgi:hypothetical protein